MVQPRSRPGSWSIVVAGALSTVLVATTALGASPPGRAASAAAAGELPDLHWRMIGPFRGGRTRAAVGVDGEPNVFYVGAVNGGVWKSEDYGRTWRPIFDDQPTQSIGAIAVAPSDGRIVYVGSGEGLFARPDLSVGDGIYRSADAGKTWEHLGLRDGEQIPALAVDPRDPNRLFAAVVGHPYGPNEERGLFRSTDGGKTWRKVLYRGPDVGASDVAIDPKHPDTVYAAFTESRVGPWEDDNEYAGTRGGLFKSTDGGETWHSLTRGLPQNLTQIQVAIAPSAPERLYATVSTSDKHEYASDAGMGLYRSDDGGESWRRITDDPRPAMGIGGGDLPVPRVDPRNPDVVYSASIVTCRSLDGGKTWASLRGAPGGDDYQNIWINGVDPRILLLVSDQGAVVSVNGGETWSSWYNQPTAQIYHVAVTDEFPYRVCGAQQESGSVCISSRGNDGAITFRDWHPAGIIEYGYAAPDPRHPSIVYGAGRAEVSRYDTVTGQVQNVTPIPLRDPRYRTDRTEPLLFSPLDPGLLFYAANLVFETRDGGASWRAISPDLTREHAGHLDNVPALTDADAAKRRGAVYSLAASYQDVDTLWAGTDDGLVWITHDHGAHWQPITPPDLTPWSKVTQISASRFDARTAYVSVSRFRVDDRRPYVYRTRDGGATWQPIVNGLPADGAVNTVREDPVRRGMLYAGTENGVWFSLDDGEHWRSLQLNLPHTSMRDLTVKDDDLILATHGRSFWILDDIAALRGLADPATRDGVRVVVPTLATRVRRDTNTDTPLPPDEPAGENPPDGAPIDYRLPAAGAHHVVIEILDSKGTVLRRYSSDDRPQPDAAELAAQLIPPYWVKPAQIPAASGGWHRLVWDLHETAPLATRYEYPISAVPHRTPREPLGAAVVPGEYRVRLLADGREATATLHVRMDPRVPASSDDLATLYRSQHALAALVERSAAADLAAHSIREQIAAVRRRLPAADPTLDALDAAVAALLDGTKAPAPVEATSAAAADSDSREGLDSVSGAASALYQQIGQADARPTAAQVDAAKTLGPRVDRLTARWNVLEREQLPRVNRRLGQLHAGALDPRRAPQTQAAAVDED